jgi:hypothetical protein
VPVSDTPHPATPLPSGRTLFEAVHRATRPRHTSDPDDELQQQDLRLLNAIFGHKKMHNRSRQAPEDETR